MIRRLRRKLHEGVEQPGWKVVFPGDVRSAEFGADGTTEVVFAPVVELVTGFLSASPHQLRSIRAVSQQDSQAKAGFDCGPRAAPAQTAGSPAQTLLTNRLNIVRDSVPLRCYRFTL